MKVETQVEVKVKTPSTVHKGVPVNEYTYMKLAEVAGAQIPPIRLIALTELDGLPDIRLPDERFAYGIQRFDRTARGRVHTEDFAQVFGLYPTDKYQKINYEQLGQVVYRQSGDKLTDIQQMARRLLINLLLGNGDAHIKNWTLIYTDFQVPRLSPLYDVVFTAPYIAGDGLALNMTNIKNWKEMNLSHFEHWAKKVGVPWPAIRVHLLDVLEKARQLWPEMLNELPMLEEHKALLIKHWSTIHQDFQIKT